MGAIICPTVTAEEPHVYREQMERVAGFAERIHIDLGDGVFTPNKLIDIDRIWWPAGVVADIHLMYKAVKPFQKQLISLRPNLVIIHAEAVGNFYEVARPLKKAGIRIGVALLASTPISTIRPAIDDIDHVLIFSGDLGHFGGKVDLRLLDKVRALKKIKPNLEIGWDGGVNTHNARALTDGGVNVLNVGGSIQRSSNPGAAYTALTKAVR